MYRVALQNFEGPLDLLLFFIKRDEIDIRDIPISRITNQFVDYLHLMEELDLDIASEFILMAGTLMSIKARMLLPRVDLDEDDMTEDDPRYELVQSLLEYKRYKEMGEEFRSFELSAATSYYRGNFAPDQVTKPKSGEALKDVSLIHLMAAIQDVLLRRVKEESFHHVEKFETNIEEQSSRILGLLRKNGRTSFQKLCEEVQSRMVIVVTFLSVLEMIKEGQLDLFITEDDQFNFHIDIPRVDSAQLLEST